jgi:hypothetical protein
MTVRKRNGNRNALVAERPDRECRRKGMVDPDGLSSVEGGIAKGGLRETFRPK